MTKIRGRKGRKGKEGLNMGGREGGFAMPPMVPHRNHRGHTERKLEHGRSVGRSRAPTGICEPAMRELSRFTLSPCSGASPCAEAQAEIFVSPWFPRPEGGRADTLFGGSALIRASYVGDLRWLAMLNLFSHGTKNPQTNLPVCPLCMETNLHSQTGSFEGVSMK